MTASESVDIRLGLYDRPLYVVDYYSQGTMGAAELLAVITFPLDKDAYPIPIAILPIEQAGGFLRGKKTAFQIFANNCPLPSGKHTDYGTARIDGQSRALGIGARICSNDPEWLSIAANPSPFEEGFRLFSTRVYDAPVGDNGNDVLEAVVHFEHVQRPSVPFFIGKQENENGSSVYLTIFDPGGDEIQIISACGTIEKAGEHISHMLVPVASALYGVASTSSFENKMTLLGMDNYKIPGTSGMTAKQAQQEYEKLLRNIRQKLNR